MISPAAFDRFSPGFRWTFSPENHSTVDGTARKSDGPNFYVFDTRIGEKYGNNWILTPIAFPGDGRRDTRVFMRIISIF